MRANACGIHPADQTRSAWPANRRVAKRSGEPGTLAGQPVQIRCSRVTIIVAAQFRPGVLADDPNYVGSARDKRGSPDKQTDKRKHDSRQQNSGFHNDDIRLAEGERFELSLGLPLSLISSQVPSTTQPPFHTF